MKRKIYGLTSILMALMLMLSSCTMLNRPTEESSEASSGSGIKIIVKDPESSETTGQSESSGTEGSSGSGGESSTQTESSGSSTENTDSSTGGATDNTRDLFQPVIDVYQIVCSTGFGGDEFDGIDLLRENGVDVSRMDETLVEMHFFEQILGSNGEAHYTFMDIDGDGVEELLITSLYYDREINALFMLVNGIPTMLLAGWSRSSYYTDGYGHIFHTASLDAATYYVSKMYYNGDSFVISESIMSVMNYETTEYEYYYAVERLPEMKPEDSCPEEQFRDLYNSWTDSFITVLAANG